MKGSADAGGSGPPRESRAWAPSVPGCGRGRGRRAGQAPGQKPAVWCPDPGPPELRAANACGFGGVQAYVPTQRPLRCPAPPGRPLHSGGSRGAGLSLAVTGVSPGPTAARGPAVVLTCAPHDTEAGGSETFTAGSTGPGAAAGCGVRGPADSGDGLFLTLTHPPPSIESARPLTGSPRASAIRVIFIKHSPSKTMSTHSSASASRMEAACSDQPPRAWGWREGGPRGRTCSRSGERGPPGLAPLQRRRRCALRPAPGRGPGGRRSLGRPEPVCPQTGRPPPSAQEGSLTCPLRVSCPKPRKSRPHPSKDPPSLPRL